jgi:hypothetical protein
LFANTLVTTPNLLIKGTKAGIYDGSANNNILLEGSTFKVGIAETINAGSNYTDNTLIFNGVINNNYLQIPASPSLDFSGDFWIDFWMNSSKWKTDTISRRILTLGSVSSVSALHICINASGTDKKLMLFSNANILSSNFEYADGAWHHVGIGRKGSTLSIYRDGVFDASATNTIDYTDGISNGAFIGIYGDASRNKGRYGGKLVGLRIINGECVHTSNYTLPSDHSSLTDDGGEGVNNATNVVFYAKLNNVVSSLNYHVINTFVENLTSATLYPPINSYNLSNVNALTSSRLPARPAPGTTASFFTPSANGYLRYDNANNNFKLNGDFTIEAYVYPLSGTDANGRRTILVFRQNDYWKFAYLKLAYLSGAYYLESDFLPNGYLSAAGALNAWSHVAVCKKSDRISLYVNGTRTAASTATIDGSIILSNHAFIDIGNYYDDSVILYRGPWYGDIYNVRIIDGRAIYEGNFNTTTTVVASSLSTTYDTVFLYNDAKDVVYYSPGPLEKLVVGGYASSSGTTPITINASLSYWSLHNVQVQNGGTLLASGSGTLNVAGSGLKIAGGGQFILSSASTIKKNLTIDESKIAVLAGGKFNVGGIQKTKSADLSGYYVAGLSSFTLNQTPTNWLSGDSLIFIPNSASRTSFEELTARRTNTNRISTNTLTQFDHHGSSIPSVVNATRNVAVKGVSTNRRGYIQFDASSNSTICDVEFEHMGRDGAKSESLVFNVSPTGYFLLSGCYLDGSTGTSINATSLYRDSNNVNIIDNVFYKYSDSTIFINKGATNFNISNNLSLYSTNHGLKLVNANIGNSVVMQNNLAIGNTGKGIYLENTEGNITGWNTWLNGGQGIYTLAPTIGQNVDAANASAVMTETNTTNLVKFDSPFGESYPNETSANIVAGNISWDASNNYVFDDDFTFECFFKFTGTATTIIFGSDVQSSGGFALSYIPATFEFRLATYVGTTATTRLTKPLVFLQKNKWHHVALVRKDDVVSIFLAGTNIASVSLNDELIGTSKGITLGWSSETSTSSKSIYGFRVLKRAEYDSASNSITVPVAPFTVDADTVLLYKKTVKTGSLNINNISNHLNSTGGILLDNNDSNLKNTKLSNVSAIRNTTYGMSVDGTNTYYTSASPFTAVDMYIADNTTFGININNAIPTISGVYAIDNNTAGIRMKLGEGRTNVSAVTSLMKLNTVPNLIIYSSKSYQTVSFDNIVLDKSANLAAPYTVAPLQLSSCNFSNFNFDNSTLNTHNTAFAISLSSNIEGSYTFTNTTITSAGVRGLSCLPDENIKSSGIVYYNKNRVTGQHETVTKKGSRATDTSIRAGNIGEKISPTSSTQKMKSGSKYIVVNQGDTNEVSLKIAKSANYNGSNPRVMMAKNPALGFDTDVVMYTYTGNNTNYDDISFMTLSPSRKGILEFYVDCDGTAGSIYIDSWNTI